MISEEVLIRLALVLGIVLLLLYQFGYRDRFPFIGKNLWRDRPFYREIEKILMRQVERSSLGAELPEATLERIASTTDMILDAFNKDYESIQVNLPNLDVGAQTVDFSYDVTRHEVLNTHVSRK